MSLAEKCCSAPPSFDLLPDYKPLGETKPGLVPAIPDMDVYVPKTEPNFNTKSALVVMYDLLGLTPQAYQFADHMSQSLKCHVIMPDFFRGEKAPMAQGMVEVKKFLTETTGSWDKHTKADLTNILNWFRKEKGVEKIGIVGFCWGGRAVFNAGAQMPDLFQAGACAHPAFLVEEDGTKMKVPICNLPSKDENEAVMSKIHDNLAPDIRAKSIFKVFKNMDHGWALGRGDYNVPEQKKGALEAHQIFIDYFKNFL